MIYHSNPLFCRQASVVVAVYSMMDIGSLAILLEGGRRTPHLHASATRHLEASSIFYISFQNRMGKHHFGHNQRTSDEGSACGSIASSSREKGTLTYQRHIELVNNRNYLV